MKQRQYGTAEIMFMRSLVECLCHTGFQYDQGERNEQVELQLRTYLENGIEPNDLAKCVAPSWGFSTFEDWREWKFQNVGAAKREQFGK